MAAPEKADDVAERKAMLFIASRKNARHADRAKNAETRQFVVVIHLAFSDADVRPLKWCGGLALCDGADVCELGFTEPRTSTLITMSERVKSELGVSGTVKASRITNRIQCAARKSD